MTPLEIWCNLPLSEPAADLLRAGTAAHHLVWAPEAAKQGPPPDAEVAFGSPDADACAASAQLAWIHLSSAGYTAFDRAAVRAALAARGAVLTNSSSVYAEPCAQHVLALMLADARQLPRALRHQLGDRVWSSREARAASTLLGEQTVLVVGAGAIARRLAELLAPFGAHVVGVRRRPRGDDGFPTVALAELEAWLPRAEHVVSTLPANEGTLRFFDEARFAAMQAGAVFYNVGRGTTVDQSALERALTGGRLRAAYLDVTDPEPLPPEHPLWSLPSCVITPHAAGGFADEQEALVRHFLENLRRRDAGVPLADRVC